MTSLSNLLLKDEPVLELDNLGEFLALKEGILTQIRLPQSVTDNLEIGQEIEISLRGTNKQFIKRKITQIHNAPFLETSTGDESIIHFMETPDN